MDANVKHETPDVRSKVAEAKPNNGLITVDSLIFKNITEDHAPEQECDQCHQKKPGKGQLYAEIPVRPGTNFTIVICSDRCLYMFRRRKNIDKILRETVNNIRKKMRMQAIKMMGR